MSHRATGAPHPGPPPTGGRGSLDLARFDRLTTSPAWQVVAESLRRKIAVGLYRPGDPLPSERQLAEGMGVSRITVREALRVPQGERLVETRRSNAGGALVLGPPHSRPASEAHAELRRECARFLHILECRLANEALAARLAADLRTDAHLDALEETMVATEAASRTLAERHAAGEDTDDDWGTALNEFRHQDSTFHLTIAAIPANPYLYRTVEWLRSEFFTPLDLIQRSRTMQQDSVGEHRAILEAIRDRDAGAATQAMCAHIESTRLALYRLLGRYRTTTS